MSDKRNAYRAAIAGAILLFIHQGMNATFSIHLPYFVETFQAPASTIALAASFGTIASFIWSLLMPAMLKAIKARGVMLLSSILGLGYGLIHCYSQNVGMLWLAGIFGGTVLGLGTSAATAAIVSPHHGYWGAKMPRVISIVFSFSALGGAAYLAMCGQLIPRLGWRNNYLVIGGSVFVIGIVTNLLLLRTPKAAPTATGAAQAAKPAAPQEDGLTLKEAMRTPSFYLLFLGIVFCATMYYGCTTYLASFWQSHGMSPTAAANYNSILKLISMAVVFISGFILTNFGVKAFIGIVHFGGAAGIVCLIMWPSIQSAWFTILCLILIVLASPVLSISSQLIPLLFGRKDYSSINSVSMGAFFLGIALSSWLVGKIAEVAGGFTNAFIAVIVIGVVGFVCCMLSLAMAPYKKIAAAKAAKAVEA